MTKNNYILIIDDSSVNRAFIDSVIRKTGYPTMHATDGLDALDKCVNIRDTGDSIALCIVDINMPRLDGLEFIRQFRKMNQPAPIVVLTGEDDETAIQGNKLLDASVLMCKPFSISELLFQVNNLLGL
ncbi:MAG: hypothetical protein A2176_14850 [Spirochaetes bacterium RBG_13_51_14]|nr:MAG: hypothetical protein A2176_14850 [Spirochaetes bacterium RBG_13_51_14]